MDNIALFASHNGSIFDTLYEASIKKELFINISLVISNNSNAPILDKAKENHIPYFVVNDKLYNDTDLALVQLLEKYECKYVVLAGYMKKYLPFWQINILSSTLIQHSFQNMVAVECMEDLFMKQS